MISHNILSLEQPAFPWPPAPGDPALRDGDVHVWGASLQNTPARIETLRRLLSNQELQRADRFRFSSDAERFTVSHAILRIILGWYTNISPGAIEFSYGESGKPGLLIPRGRGLYFNMSRAAEVALYAIALGIDVGVDIERIESDFEVDGIAERFFSPPASNRIRTSAGSEKRDAFFCHWVSREAYAKATGEGLSFALTRALSSATDTSAQEKYSGWSLEQLDVGADYRAALVTRSGCNAISCFWWSGAGILDR